MHKHSFVLAIIQYQFLTFLLSNNFYVIFRIKNSLVFITFIYLIQNLFINQYKNISFGIRYKKQDSQFLVCIFPSLHKRKSHQPTEQQMKSFNKILKPFLYTSLGIGGGVGTYYIFNSYQKNLQQTNSDKIQIVDILQNTVPKKIQSPKEQQMKSIKQQSKYTVKEQIIQNCQNQTEKQQKKPEGQINKQQIPIQNKVPVQQMQSNQTQVKYNQVEKQTATMKLQDFNLINKKSIILQQQASQSAQKPQKSQQLPKIVSVFSINNNLKRLSQLPDIPQLTENKLSEQSSKNIIIIPDIGYTQQFEQKILNSIKSLKKLPNSKQIVVYRANLLENQTKQLLTKQYKVNLKQESIFLMKSQLDDNFVNVDFDMYMQFPSIINTYLGKNKIFDLQNKSEYLKKLQKMSPNQSYLLYIYDNNEASQKKTQRILTSKYLQMELALHHLDNGIKVVPVQASLAKQTKVIPQNLIKPNSLHIIRKHNQFTHASPNFFLNFDNQLKPYHFINDIAFNNKKGNIAIPTYLQKIQTFNTLSTPSPYILSLTIDKNRISTDNYKKIMDTFKQLKRKNKHLNIGFALKFGQVGYLGKDQCQNKQFLIKMANLAELQNQSSIHQIQKIEDAQYIGITQQNWLKGSFEYLYPHQVVSEDLLFSFIQKVLNNQVPQYYRSDRPSALQNVHKIVASNFDRQILANKNDHFIFQYSQHCPSCKMISPLIGYLNQVISPIPLEQRFDMHVMNSQKNRVKSQVYSPYTPNINYYKNQWKHKGPVKIGLDILNRGGPMGLLDFCRITYSLGTIDSLKFNETIKNAKGWDKKEFLL